MPIATRRPTRIVSDSQVGTLLDSGCAAVGATGSTAGSDVVGEDGPGVVSRLLPGSAAADLEAPGDGVFDDAGPPGSGVVESLASGDGESELVGAVGEDCAVAGGELLVVVSVGPGERGRDGFGLRVGVFVADDEGDDELGAEVVGDWEGVDVGVGAGVATGCAVAACPGARRVPPCQVRPM